MHYPIPANEPERLAELNSLGLLYSAEEDDYNNIATLVAFIADCPTGHVSIIGEDVQWLKAKVGAGDKETPREHALCAHAIMQDEIMVVEDTTQDERFVNNPLVTGPQHLRFYAGVPIYTPSGHAIGTVCALDDKPKKLSEAQKKSMWSVAQQASRLIELRKKNMQLAQYAAEQLQLERNTLNKQLVQQEEERELIGFELHENYCQTVAATMHQLAIAEEGAPHAGLIRQVRMQLGTLLQNMRGFSAAIYPVGQISVEVEHKLRQMLSDFGHFSKLTIQCVCDGDLDKVSTANMNHLFRIVFEWLHVYETAAEQKPIIHVRITVAEHLTLHIWNEGQDKTEAADHMITFNSIRKRCNIVGGEATRHNWGNNNVRLEITMPLH